MSIYTDIGQNIISVRRKKGITQEELALSSSMSVSHLRSIEHGRANPSMGLLSRIAESLEVPVHDMIAPCPEQTADPEEQK